MLRKIQALKTLMQESHSIGVRDSLNFIFNLFGKKESNIETIFHPKV